MKRLFLLPILALSGCNSSPRPSAALPTFVPSPTTAPISLPSVTPPTPGPTTTPIPTTVPLVSAPVFRKGQSFRAYALDGLAAIDAATTRNEASEMSLYWWSQESDLRREAQRSRVAGDGHAPALGEAAGLMSALGEAASVRFKYLDGRMTKYEYDKTREGYDRSIPFFGSRVDGMTDTQTPQEKEGQQTLDAVKRGMGSL